MGKSSSQKMEVNEYKMSVHFGVCAGPVDALLEVVVDDKLAWSGEVGFEGEILINEPNLYGGPQKEGGLNGWLMFLPGGPTQVFPEKLANRLGLTSATCPGFRGLTSIFMYGTPGFTWKSNNPYLPGTWVKVRRRPRGLSDTFAMIGQDANPAHMIFECLTNTDWGMGSPNSLIDVVSFQAAAEALYWEGFGLSMIWTRQAKIEDFITEILDHIMATFFVNPTTGLMTLKLIRDDYDLNSLPVLTPDNCKVTKFQRKLWGETTNEIQVTWTNPVNEQEETVIQQDLANISQQGLVSDNRNYYGVRNADLATQLAVRDLRAAATPLATFEIDINRSAWNFLPGGLVKLTYPEHNIYELVLRIGPVSYGKAGSPTIKITATEDIFTQQTQAYVAPPSSGWVDPSEDPSPMAYVRPFTLPAFLVANSAGFTADEVVYPETIIGFLATQAGTDTSSFDLIGETVDAAGNVSMTYLGSRQLVGRTTLQAPLVAEGSTLFPSFSVVVGPVQPAVARLVFIGDAADSAMEIALIKSASEDGWILERGVLDTVPKAWPAGTPIRFVEITSSYFDDRLQAAGDSLDYKLLPRTSKGVLAADDAPLITYSPDVRPHRPLRPANVKVGSTAFGTLSNAGFGPWNVTWSNRNRLTEDSQVLAWTGANVTPESGQTTTIQVLNPTTRAVISTFNGLTGTSYSLQASAFNGASQGIVRVTSKRGGIESLQGHEILMTGVA